MTNTMKFLLSMMFALVISGSAHAAPSVTPVWDDPEWKSCLSKFKKTYKKYQNDSSVYFVTGRCTNTYPKDVRTGQCFMGANGPTDLFNMRDFEVQLMCESAAGKAEITCTNWHDHYIDEIENTMRTDKRCVGFPDLLAKRVSTPAYSKKDGAAIEKYFKTWRYSDLPTSFRYANDNKDPKCRKLVARIRQIENDPGFEHDRAVGARWSSAIERADQLGCKL